MTPNPSPQTPPIPAVPLGVPAIRLHDLRHSHVTQLLDAGVRPDIVTERLGHASVALTLQQYGHRFAVDQRSVSRVCARLHAESMPR
jgi:integrase